jgi:hypothetical protein
MVAALYVDYILSLAIQPWGIMKNSISIDGIANIMLVDGVVRFDLVKLSITGQASQENAPQKLDQTPPN